MMQDRSPKSTWTHVFTDGSTENAVGKESSGDYISRPDGTTAFLSSPAGDLSPNYRAVVHTLKAATELLIKEDYNQQNIVLLSDSLSALQSLTNVPTDIRTQQLHNRVVLQWVPAQVSIAGDKTVDRPAKAAAKLPQPTSPPYTKNSRQISPETKNKGCDPQNAQINTLVRRT